jgi:phosphatidylserine decarboxylase
MITKYGYNTVAIIAVIVFLIFAISIFINIPFLRYAFIIIGIAILLFTLNFFRDPERSPPDSELVVVSPADGKVIEVRKKKSEKFVEGESWQISIFMSPLDVHVNRIPISGKVEFLNYVEGEYLVAFHEKADERNERTEIGIASKLGKVLFTQVAGTVARRIVYEVEIGDEVRIGERFGMIKFGSRSDVTVDSNWIPKVKVGEKVKAGETILFEYKKKDILP